MKQECNCSALFIDAEPVYKKRERREKENFEIKKNKIFVVGSPLFLQESHQ
jgi:hypothetical protein